MVPNHEDGNPDLRNELEQHLRAAALKIFGEPQLLGWLLRGSVPEASKYDPQVLASCIQKLGWGGGPAVGADTGDACREIFDLSFMVTFPDGQDPFLFLLNIDDVDEDRPDALMKQAEADAMRIVQAQEQDEGPFYKVHCLRVVMNPPEGQRHKIARAEGGGEPGYEVCICHFGDPSGFGR